jgi:UDP-N-acetylmuramate dehydrogenase
MIATNAAQNLWSDDAMSVDAMIQNELTTKIQGAVFFDEPMSRHTTLQTGGAVDVWIEPAGLEDCKVAQEIATAHELSIMMVGRGSNLLVRDGGIRGIVLHIGAAFQEIAVRESSDSTYIIDAGAGVMIKQLLSWVADQGLSGIEGLEGVPGTVGGAVAMNAGTPHGSIGDAVVSVTLLEKGRVIERAAEKMEFSYRKAKLARATTVLSVRLKLTHKDPAEIKAKLQELRAYRQSKQPLQLPSVGSVFKNPDKTNTAGKLIEESGLKGVRVGRAQVSPQHANWIVNLGGATAKDVEVLIKLIRDTVKEKTGFVLEPEVKIIGEVQ